MYALPYPRVALLPCRGEWGCFGFIPGFSLLLKIFLPIFNTDLIAIYYAPGIPFFRFLTRLPSEPTSPT